MYALMKTHEKPIFFERHAQRRMAQRGIKENEVFETIRRPHKTGPAERENAKRVEHSFATNRRIVVIIEEGPSFIRVVSTWKK